MPAILRAVLGVIVGYAVGVAAGAAMISLLSGNTHDKSMEMAMTAAFVTGPLGAGAGLIASLMWKRRANRGDGSGV